MKHHHLRRPVTLPVSFLPAIFSIVATGPRHAGSFKYHNAWTFTCIYVGKNEEDQKKMPTQRFIFLPRSRI